MDELKKYIYENMHYTPLLVYDEDDDDETFDFYEAYASIQLNGYKYCARYAGSDYNNYNILVNKLAQQIVCRLDYRKS
ncbi:hypothetical protein crov104 [Cafeteria roenbergensis virus]|uniref:Uncharacterized protein n=1 Tax=Cafeteria roenbergensis virus (strain BV-PW1) TaxID=693272 RepID=E3T4M4_CROVB|nr:hypothetical protein crov104 [Cafeteria roenbergensis virus BV-PW1]ADO67137.1 hypothetical protein crov104 [Cafeteria roenbergensis virus BV-PW1]